MAFPLLSGGGPKSSPSTIASRAPRKDGALLLFSPAGASLPMTRVILILVAVFLILTVIRMVLSSRRR